MDKSALKEASDRLETLLRLYAPSNNNADLLYRQLSRFLSEASRGTINSPVDQITGSRLFSETDLRNLPGLESAFAKFELQITGGETEAYKEAKRLFEARHGSIDL